MLRNGGKQVNKSSQTQQMKITHPTSSSQRLDETLWSFTAVFILLKSTLIFTFLLLSVAVQRYSHCLQNGKSNICSLTETLYTFQRPAMW